MLTNVKDKLNKLMQEKTTPKKREYYSYPVVDSEERNRMETVNSFIGVFCPRGYYYQEGDGKIKITKDNTKVVTASVQLQDNLHNYMNGKTLDNSSKIESFGNFNEIKGNKFMIQQSVIVAVFLLIILVLFLKKIK